MVKMRAVSLQQLCCLKKPIPLISSGPRTATTDYGLVLNVSQKRRSWPPQSLTCRFMFFKIDKSLFETLNIKSVDMRIMVAPVSTKNWPLHRMSPSSETRQLLNPLCLRQRNFNHLAVCLIEACSNFHSMFLFSLPMVKMLSRFPLAICLAVPSNISQT